MYGADRDAVERFKACFRHDLIGRAEQGLCVWKHEQNLVGNRRRVVRLVRGEGDCQLPPVSQPTEQRQHDVLVLEIKRRSRFVEQQHVVLAGQRPRDQYQLALPSRKGSDAARGIIGHTGCFERRHRLLDIDHTGRAEERNVSRAAHQHDIQHRIGKGAGEFLRHEASLRIGFHATGGRLQKPREHAQKRGFAAAVRAEDGGDLTAHRLKSSPRNCQRSTS